MAGFIYLDNAASTRTPQEVIDEMLPFFGDKYGIPSSQFSHQMGITASDALENSRAKIAAFIGAEPQEIIFTSGGTESNNIAIRGYLSANPDKKHIITSKIEHYSVLHIFRRLETEGYRVTYLDVDETGIVDIKQLADSLSAETALVSIQTVNQEVGTLQDIEKIGELCKRHGVPFHTDSVLALGWLPFDVRKSNVSMASFSAHKFYGPKGVGALYINKDLKLQKLFEGGYSENNLRPGALNLPGIVGFAKALDFAREDELRRVKALRDRLLNGLLSIKYTMLNGAREENRILNNANVTFSYVEGESIVLHLDMRGIEVITGSACFSRALEPSHVLMSMGLSHEDAHGSIRYTLSRFTTEEDIDKTIINTKEVVDKLREISPLYHLK